jgi:hypothetical protein
MKFNSTNVVIGAVVIAIVLYFLKPSKEGFAPSDDGFEKTFIILSTVVPVVLIFLFGLSIVLYSRFRSNSV